MTVIDSVRFSFATRKRLYFANFDCLSENDLPAIDGSPVMSQELETVLPDQAEMAAYFEGRDIDSRFIETDVRSHNETPFDKTLVRCTCCTRYTFYHVCLKRIRHLTKWTRVYSALFQTKVRILSWRP